ncbi:transient receptor potential cation channel subfamily M member 3 [Aplysia californica]|uniref:Transient receptor potential cation channel subfamily M member 3 n=1 Tax=Aplysia californica TaxID=6500 RepID=A0ABM0JIE3_APLCA|nr:transient receptor potential cation channel subfamily M member 3 [Aplysia californica]
MATGGVRVHPSDDMGGRMFGAGGPSMSRHSESEMYSSLSAEKSPTSKTLTLEEAYWTDRRRKIGLSRHQTQEPEQDNEFQRIREELVTFVTQRFHQKECGLFIPVPDQVGKGKKCMAKYLKCHCGEILSMHAGMRSRSVNQQFENCFLVPPEFAPVLKNPNRMLTEELPKTSAQWTEECLNKSRTNAFGKITFNIEQIGGKKPAKYVRLCKEDSVEDCLEMMQKFWRIMEPEPPNLVISVVGGAKNFKLDGRMRETFSSGLIKAAKTTNAWLITSGFNMGVMKAVGQAVHEGQTFQWDNDRMAHVLRCIGIAPWGYVRGRQFLESRNGAGKFNAYYRTSTQILHKQPVPLNPDHTHFIFVDDGYRIRYGGVAEFRSKFEKKIATHKRDGGLGVPVVLLLVEGGTDAIQDVSASLAQGIPVVICAGTGRAADILAYAYNHTNTTHNKERVMSDYHQDKLARKIYSAYKTYWKAGKEREELDKWMKKVLGCCQREDLMTIFNMNKHEELDLAILSVLLKGETNSSRENQLKLAMTWNRADIAQEEILREDVIWKDGSLEEVLTLALVENKVEFVKLLLQNGIIMREYLTIARLEHLYNSTPKYSFANLILTNFLKSSPFTLEEIGDFIRDMLDKFDLDTVTQDSTQSRGKKKGKRPFRPRSSLRQPATTDDTDAEDERDHFKRPYKELMIWAIIMNRSQMAQLFWEFGDEPITSALVATRLCQQMECHVPKYLYIIRLSFHDMKNEFEKLAISVLDECHATDPKKAIMVVERKSPTWSRMTCLQIAAAAGDQAFVSSVACQDSINNVWKSGIMSRWPKVVLGVLFPPFILFCVDIGLMGKAVMSKTQKVFTFYTAPVTKFTMHTLSYFGFLILYSYVLLVDYGTTPSASEWILLLWVSSFLAGGIYSLIMSPSPTFWGKIRDYFGLLDRFDLLNNILFFIAFIVRWYYVYDGKVIYCFNAVIFYLRLMKVYTANRTLGPKIYMINRMFAELTMFLIVLMVFLLAYGVASQGLLYKQRQRDWVILKDVLYFPYWQLYGEIFLEEFETDENCIQTLTASLNGTLSDSVNTCRQFHWLVPILLAGYLLVGNVLLINLLIAIFSHVFETVEKNAIEIWKFQMYFLVMEFQNSPLLFPPFSIIFHFGYLLRWLYKTVVCRKHTRSAQFLKHHLEYLALFEKEMMANRLRAIKANVMQSMDMKFKLLQTRMDDLTRVIEDELIAEQYNMMPSMTSANTVYAEFGLGETEPEETLKVTNTEDPIKTDVDSKEERRHRKHKKHKKKKDRDVSPAPDLLTIHEEKHMNILTPEEDVKQLHDKVISDDENQSPDAFVTEADKQQNKTTTSTLTLSREPRQRQHQRRQETTPQMGSFHSGALALPSDSRSPIIAIPQQFRFAAPEQQLDSDEEPIPLDIYSPRASNLTVSAHSHMGDDGNVSDVSAHSQTSIRISRPRLRRHLSRGRDGEMSLHSRFERANRSSHFSSKLL